MTPALVKRMRYPRPEGGSRASPKEDDWRLRLAGLLEPGRPEPLSPGESEAPPETEVDLPFLPLTSAEAREHEAQAESVDSAIEECLRRTLAEAG